MPALCIREPERMKVSLIFLLTIFRSLVIPVQFQDREFSYGEQDMQSILSKAEDYLNTQFRDTRTFSFDLAPTVILPQQVSYYGMNGEREHDLLIHEAVLSACKASGGIDFSVYDNDGDGTVDGLILLTAGTSESDGAGEDEIWPACYTLSSRTIPIIMSGKWINPFIVFTEIKSINGLEPRLNGPGDLCHEMCHIFNLPDFYDTDGLASGGISSALWQTTSLMDEGNRNDFGNTPPGFNSIEMELLGLGECIPMAPGGYTLQPLDKEGRYLRAEGRTEGEYFLVECRDNKGWDEFIGGAGLLAYYIDKREPESIAKWNDNKINCNPNNQCARIIEASSEARSAKDVFFTGKGRKVLSLGDYGINLALTDITRNNDGSVSFNVTEPMSVKETVTFQDAAVISWELDPGIGLISKNIVTWHTGNDEEQSIDTGSRCSVLIEDLAPQTEYGIRIESITPEGESFIILSTFTTKNRVPGIPPYIIFNGVGKNEDGSIARGSRIPLRISNVTDYEAIEWFLDGRRISVDASGYYTIQQSGTLKAKVKYSDGSTDILIKEMTVR